MQTLPQPCIQRENGEFETHTLVLKRLADYADRIADKNKIIREGLTGEDAAPSDVTYHDSRLKPKTMVLGLDVEGASKAFPLDALRHARVVNGPARRQGGVDRAPADIRYNDGVRNAGGREDAHIRGGGR